MTGCPSPGSPFRALLSQPSGCALLGIGFYEQRKIVCGRYCFFGFGVGDQRYGVKASLRFLSHAVEQCKSAMRGARQMPLCEFQ
jgi:hypothetical protein